MADWPTGGDTKTWMREKGIGDAGDDALALDECTQAATDVIRASLEPALMPDDADDCPTAVRLAIMMRAASLYRRKDSVTGILSVGPDSVIRVNRFDSDVDNLLAPYTAAGIL